MLRTCPPEEIASLLPGALAGEYCLAPLPSGTSSDHLDPTDPLVQTAAVVVSTSGSTGRPKGVALTADALLAGARATHEHLGRPLTWVSPLPGQYVAGLMTMVRALEAGTRALRCASDLSDLDVPDEPSAISLVPTQLVRALAQPGLLDRLRTFHTILLGGAAASSTLLDRAREAGLSVVTSYGMSETCGGCVYDGVPLPGLEVAVDETRGRVRLRGPMLFAGYLGDPVLSRETLHDGWLHTQDRGTWADDRLTILGRIDDVVISGGVNVDLAHLQRVVDDLAHGSAAVVAVPDPEWGATVVLVTDDPTATDLQAWRTRLASLGIEPAGLPRHVLLGPLPRLASGKIDRQGLAAWAAGRHAAHRLED
ncbi:AMP-binding protein [Aestuariimicrobium ganziense]|uniref:AMP-binding protein n=1 Tax=Aestuariimicrobium ganziense TaxID=2773677 RepID=UPI001944D0CB|nr:AMP-binding protein [Aestuariimicrobium ganziense]